MWNSENWIEVNFQSKDPGWTPCTVLKQAVYPAAIAIRVSAIFILIAPFLLTSSARFQRSSDVSLSRGTFCRKLPRFRIDRASQSSRHGRVRFTSSRLKPCDPPLSGCCLLTQPPRPPLFYFSLLSLSLNLS